MQPPELPPSLHPGRVRPEDLLPPQSQTDILVNDDDVALDSSPIEPGRHESAYDRAPRLFREPFWFRFAVVLFILPAALAMASLSWVVATSGETVFVLIAVFAIEPLVGFLFLACGALIAPRSVLGRTLLSRKRSVFIIIGVWVAVFTAIAIGVSAGWLH